MKDKDRIQIHTPKEHMSLYNLNCNKFQKGQVKMLGKWEQGASSQIGFHVEITFRKLLLFGGVLRLGVSKGIDSTWNNMFVKFWGRTKLYRFEKQQNPKVSIIVIQWIWRSMEHAKAGGRPGSASAEDLGEGATRDQ